MLSSLFTKNKTNILELFFWIFSALLFPLIGGELGAFSIFKIVIYIATVFFVGDIFISKISSISSFPSLVLTGIKIIFGSLICGLCYLFIPNHVFIYSLFILLISIKIRYKLFYFKFNFWQDIIYTAPLFLVLIKRSEIRLGMHSYLTSVFDVNYYTTIVASLKLNHSYSNAVYHQGIGINYQSLTFFSPAQLANFSQISAQTALWGIYIVLLAVVAYSVAATSIVKLFAQYFRLEVSKMQYYFMHFFALNTLLFFWPFFIKNILTFNLKNALSAGNHLIMPIKTPGFILGFLFLNLVLFIILTIEKPTLKHKAIIGTFLCIILASKFAMFFSFTIFLGLYAIILALKKNYSWLITLIFLTPIFFLIYKFTIGNNDSIFAFEIAFKGTYSGYKPSNNKLIISKSFISFIKDYAGLLWYKFIILGIAIIYFYKKNAHLFWLSIVALLTFMVAALPSFFLNIFAVDSKGLFLYDNRFDTVQFIVTAVFIVTIISIIILLYFIYCYHNKIIKCVVLTGSILWLLIVSVCFLRYNDFNITMLHKPWYYDVVADFNKVKPKLSTILGSEYYNGQMLVTGNVYPWYCTGLRTNYAGYVNTKTAHNRNIIFQQLLDTTIAKSKRIEVLHFLKTKGVDCVVATPNSILQINNSVKDSLLSKIIGTQWLYKLN